jgi:hypothetical protein
VDTAFLNGLAEVWEKLVILLDIEKVLTAADTDGVTQAALEPGSWN